MGKEKKRKKGKIALGILGVLLVVIAVAVGLNWDTIQSVRVGLTTSPEEIARQQEERKAELQEELGIVGGITEEEIAAFTEEIEALLAGNSASESEDRPQEDGVESSTTEEGNSSSSPSTGTSEEIVRKYTAKLYATEGAFQGRLNGLVAAAKAEYAALPEGERTSAKKAAIVSSKVGAAEALESQCDATVESILSQMRSELAAAGGDTSAVDRLRSFYQEEKASQKAAYMGMMRSGGG